MPPGYWLDKRNVKDFFDSFASAKKFDALKPENWYSVSQKDILSEKVCYLFLFFLFVGIEEIVTT